MIWNAAASFACQTVARQDAYVRYTGAKISTAKEPKHGLPALSNDSSATTSTKAQGNSAHSLCQERTLGFMKTLFGIRIECIEGLSGYRGPLSHKILKKLKLL